MGKLVLENLIPLVFAVLSPVVLLLVHRGVQLAAKKWHLEAALQFESKLDQLILKGIKAAEQKSLNAVKGGSEKTPSEKKLQEVIDWVNAKLKAEGYPEKAAAELTGLIEAKLFDGSAKKPTA